jgi:signal peptidase I
MDNIKTLAFAFGLALLFRSFLFEPFHIPSGSMRPGLLEGDFLFVSKYSYGYSRYSFPFATRINWMEGRTGEHLPKRGDVVVFRTPQDPSVNFIKRVMGLPGDRIRVLDGKVILNGELLRYDRIDDFVFKVPGRPEGPVLRYEEELPDGHTQEVLDMTGFGRLDNTKEFLVPEGHYFMMGDNRDDSDDSRAPDGIGFVPFDHFVGRAEIIMVSFDVFSDVSLSDPASWANIVRSDRFFKVIR